MSKTSKIKELIISESHDQSPIYQGNFIYTSSHWLEATKVFQKMGRTLDIMPNSLKLPKYKKL